MSTFAKNRTVAVALAFAGALPTPLPLNWLHKFYVGQYLWGVVYLVLSPTGLPQVACCLEGLWYLSQNDADFSRRFPQAGAMLSTENATVSGLSGMGVDSSEQSAARSARGFSGGSPVEADARAGQTAPDRMAQMATALRELEQLRQEGLMTEYEFEQKRRKLLEQV
jgi:TM2 domain-containing membrane protein YozV